MEIKLMKITLNNFKGIEHLEVAANGDDVNIYGANESGKTTVADAYHWLLFNKDSNNAADFGIKTLIDGKEQHGLEHSVTANFKIDGKPVELKKIFTEIWKKKRGQTSKEFSGHETKYEINSVPKKKKEFDEYIKTIIDDESIFRLVSDPFHFNNLKTEKKREILMNIADEVTDITVIESNPDLKPLADHLENYTADELRAKNNRDKKAINEKLQENPIRIDEITKSINDINIDETAEELKASKLEQEQAMSKRKEEIEGLRSGDRLETVRSRLNEIYKTEHETLNKAATDKQTELDDYLSSYDNQNEKKAERLKYENDFEKDNLTLLEKQKEQKEQSLKSQQQYITDLRNNHRSAAEELKTIEAENKTFEVETICNCCGQELPADKVEEHREKQQVEYNKKRAEKIETLKADLTSIIQKGKKEAAAIPEIEKEIEKIDENIQQITKKIKVNSDRIKELTASVIDPKETDKYKELSNSHDAAYKQLTELKELLPERNEEYKKLKAEFETLSGNIKNVEADANEKINVHQDNIEIINNKLMMLSSVEEKQKRINELLAEQEKMADEYEKLEHIENMLNTFVTTKVKLLESSISDQFEHARFNLFEPLINGGLKEICETTYKGVPYSKGLNTAGRVNVGLDIINTLSKHYDFYTPVIIDNAESISDIFKTQSQQVRLIVSKENKTLKIEGAK